MMKHVYSTVLVVLALLLISSTTTADGQGVAGQNPHSGQGIGPASLVNGTNHSEGIEGLDLDDGNQDPIQGLSGQENFGKNIRVTEGEELSEERTYLDDSRYDRRY